MAVELALYKIRDELDHDDWGLRAIADRYKPIVTRQLPGVDYIQIITDQSREEPPKWQQDLLAIADHSELGKLKNRTTAALVLIRHRKSRFVLAFGSGWHAIDSSSIEPSFGLRVAANAIGPAELRGVATNSMTRRGRTQKVSINPGPLYDLGIETNDDLVRQLCGRPPQDFAHDVSGGDMLRLKLPDFSFSDLAYKLDEILALQNSDAYKEHFGFLDYFVRVPRTNKMLCADLDRALSDALRTDPESVGFACPEVDEEFPAEYFELRSGRQSEVVEELSSEQIAELAARWGLPDPMRDIRVCAFGSDFDEPIRDAALLQYAAADVSLGDRRFAACAGGWYQLDPDNLAAIQTRIDRIPELDPASLGLVDWTDKYPTEGHYNDEVAKSPAFELLDKKLFTGGKSGGGIEICDLLTSSKQLICVKKMERSSTLSHLFAQGHVSAQLMVDNVLDYQGAVMAHLCKLDSQASFGHPSSWTVVYAIATRKPGPLARSLYFFSKVNLDRSRALLENARVNVALVRIELSKPKPVKRTPRRTRKVRN